MPIATEGLLVAAVVLVLVVAAVLAYANAARVLHDYYLKLADTRPFRDTTLS